MFIRGKLLPSWTSCPGSIAARCHESRGHLQAVPTASALIKNMVAAEAAWAITDALASACNKPNGSAIHSS